jgi:hypothetical protein
MIFNIYKVKTGKSKRYFFISSRHNIYKARKQLERRHRIYQIKNTKSQLFNSLKFPECDIENIEVSFPTKSDCNHYIHLQKIKDPINCCNKISFKYSTPEERRLLKLNWDEYFYCPACNKKVVRSWFKRHLETYLHKKNNGDFINE